ncbi:stalk domain-containing protein [Paenibacillus thalictri]|uniref:Copper amine oxidase N-terminal domain-containing protein n=1 Tax=Paenibacillus thalictri TaxID=2527873 RepID=A0A4Q9DEX2_9BACL|nr:stalk domain-containing protein [Paenibacillus thalictri]TBL67986.1 copper amine oxidase N-terminal domain-containing protein [Paenibacillus thalictri]
MKKFVLGLGCGLVIAGSSVAFASDAIQALLFPAHFEINGNTISLNDDYKVLNVDGHAYVPIRFVAEQLGATIDYDQEQQKIFVENRKLSLSDPNYKGLHVGNLILTKDGSNTKVTGQLQIEGVGSITNAVEATLVFYNDNSEQIGEVAIHGDDFGVDAKTFVSEGLGDFRTYSTVNLHVGNVNGHIISAAPVIVYENEKNNFTLNLPKSWQGKYDVAEAIDETSKFVNISFIDIANKEYGGVVFSIGIQTKEDWSRDGQTAMEVGHISKIGELGNKVFTISTPGDVQYDPHNEELTAEYQSMSKFVNTIKTSFHANVNLTDNEVKDILSQLIPKAADVYGMFNGSGWFKVDETKTIPGENEYCLVIDEAWKTDIDTSSVRSIADLKNVVEGVFTKDIAQKLFLAHYLEVKDAGLPLYKDYEGRLYVNTNNGGHGWARKFQIETAKIKSQKNQVVEITFDATSYDDPEGTLIITIEYVNGKWLMASGLDDYESRITGPF